MGRENPKYIFCQSSECTDQLRWAGDGSTFNQGRLDWFNIDVSLMNDVQEGGNTQTECIYWYVSIKANSSNVQDMQ